MLIECLWSVNCAAYILCDVQTAASDLDLTKQYSQRDMEYYINSADKNNAEILFRTHSLQERRVLRVLPAFEKRSGSTKAITHFKITLSFDSVIDIHQCFGVS